MEQIHDKIQDLKNRIDILESEILALKRILGVKMERKDPNAWQRLEAIGKEISKSWKSEKPSWQLISESRR
ncbi:MAG: hypothetical protein ACE5KE_03820 [Methanosarcinales archaeon]